MKDRIRQLMETQHLSQQSFAEMLNISPASLSSIFNDRTRPTLNHVDAIKRSFPNINLQWLLYGEGEMFESGSPESRNPISHPHNPGTNSSNSGNGLMLDFDTTPPVASSSDASQMSGATPPNLENYHDSAPRKIIDIRQRKITEIRIFYDDQTWETFVPKK
jgi:DNA-binding XRE family transcriptional regulator